MNILIFLLLLTFSCRTADTGKNASLYISYEDESVFLKENICRDLLQFKYEFQKKNPGTIVYHSILPKTIMLIRFRLRYFTSAFGSDPEENREIVGKYYQELENMFPELEKSLNLKHESPEISVTIPQCENPEMILSKIKKLHIEHRVHRADMAHFSDIILRSENNSEKKDKYHIEFIIKTDHALSDNKIKKFLKQMKSLDKNSHTIKILR
ncbi:MAG: hypothetical protein OEZ34_04180 [Spirochaetia bacterium]|nr:hypothetical protein [Spirochaetia bacterium]